MAERDQPTQTASAQERRQRHRGVVTHQRACTPAVLPTDGEVTRAAFGSIVRACYGWVRVATIAPRLTCRPGARPDQPLHRLDRSPAHLAKGRQEVHPRGTLPLPANPQAVQLARRRRHPFATERKGSGDELMLDDPNGGRWQVDDFASPLDPATEHVDAAVRTGVQGMNDDLGWGRGLRAFGGRSGGDCGLALGRLAGGPPLLRRPSKAGAHASNCSAYNDTTRASNSLRDNPLRFGNGGMTPGLHPIHAHRISSSH